MFIIFAKNYLPTIQQTTDLLIKIGLVRALSQFLRYPCLIQQNIVNSLPLSIF